MKKLSFLSSILFFSIPTITQAELQWLPESEMKKCAISEENGLQCIHKILSLNAGDGKSYIPESIISETDGPKWVKGRQVSHFIGRKCETDIYFKGNSNPHTIYWSNISLKGLYPIFYHYHHDNKPASNLNITLLNMKEKYESLMLRTPNDPQAANFMVLQMYNMARACSTKENRQELINWLMIP